MKHLHISLAVLAALTLLLIAACGSDDDPADPTPPSGTTTGTIGAGGGSIAMAGQIELAIPAGALDQDRQFTLSAVASPPADPTGRDALGSVYSIGPSGTTFDQPATLTLHYDESDLGGADESDIVIYTSSGGAWTALPTTVDEANDRATADVVHLSYFAATMPGGEAADGVYAQFEIVRLIGLLPGGRVNRVDMASARFDSVVSPCHVIRALHPATVQFEGEDLVWDSMMELYVDQESGEFLDLGADYSYTVTASADVPALSIGIDFPDTEPYLTNIEQSQVVDAGGFSVEWEDYGEGTVLLGLAVCDPDDPSLVVETSNDGDYTFSAAELAPLPPGEYILFLDHFHRDFLDVAGYDDRSYILAGTMDFVFVRLGTGAAGIGPDGGTLALGDEGYLDIPESALASTVDFAVEVNPSPTAAPEGWAFVTDVYTVAPSGTTFSLPATLGFSWDEADLGDGDEETITLFLDDGSGWVALDTDVYGYLDNAEAEVDGTGDFCAMIETGIPADGIYANLLIERWVQYYSPEFTSRTDWIYARFDEVYDPDEAVSPLPAGGAAVGPFTLVWNADDDRYQYTIVEDGEAEFLELDTDYAVAIAAGGDVPALARNVTFPDAEPAITNYSSLDTVSLDGFTLEWAGLGADAVTLHLLDSGDEGEPTVTVETANDGSHTFTANDLSALEGPMISIELICGGESAIDQSGYDSRSTITVRTYNWINLWTRDE